MLVFNHVVNFEYVPTSFRVGIQIPLYKGKNLCSFSTDSYRGITLLNNFNKVFSNFCSGEVSRNGGSRPELSRGFRVRDVKSRVAYTRPWSFRRQCRAPWIPIGTYLFCILTYPRRSTRSG